MAGLNEDMLEGFEDIESAIEEYEGIERSGMTPEEYNDEKASAFEAIMEAVDELELTEEVEEMDVTPPQIQAITMPIIKGAQVLRTSSEYDEAVKHLGYEPITLPEGQSIPHGILTDVQLLADSQRRLAGVSPVPDDSLQPNQLAHLQLARAIVVRTAPSVREVQAAIIPPASDRVRTAGMYGRTTKEIYLATEQLASGRKTVDTTIHELAHHTSEAEDGQEAHMNDMTRLAGVVVSKVAEGTYDKLIKAPGFTWY